MQTIFAIMDAVPWPVFWLLALVAAGTYITFCCVIVAVIRKLGEVWRDEPRKWR